MPSRAACRKLNQRMAEMDFNGFRACVLADSDLQSVFHAVQDREEFVQIVVETAKQRGFEVTPGDVEQGMRAGRRAWIERWI